MQLFTADQLLEARMQAFSFVKDFIVLIIQEMWQNIIDFFPSLAEALATGNWVEAIIRLMVFVGSMVIIYRLMRKMPFRIFNSISEI